MIGRIMIASTMPAVKMVRPVTEGGPAKNGRNDRCWYSQSCSGTSQVASDRAPQSPNTTEGTAASRSMT